MIFVVVHKATVKDDFLFIVGKPLNVKRNILNASVSPDNLCRKFFVAACYFFSYSLNKNIISAFIGERSVFCKSKGKNTPVYAV